MKVRTSRRGGKRSKGLRVCHIQPIRKRYSSGRIELKAQIDHGLRRIQPRDIKFGFRLKSGQQIVELHFGVDDRPLDIEPAPDVAGELTSALPPAAEQWIGYRAPHSPLLAGARAITMKIVIEKFDIPKHGFQEVPVVFAYADEAVGSGHYLLGVCIFAGEDSIGFQARVEDRPRR